jgi:putative SOS response-associated peptidase YedK
MCGRFQLSVKGKEISERFNVEVHDEIHRPDKQSFNSSKGYNCAPLQWLPTILNTSPKKIQFLRWGLLPSWSADERSAAKMINARAETITEKPAFKTAFERRRCLIPANGFYEWRKTSQKQPYRFFLKNEEIFAMAGIWDVWGKNDGSSIHTFAILTTKANSILEGIHDRMPVILSPNDEMKWLSKEIDSDFSDILKPYPADLMDFYPVSSLVNNVSNDDERLIKPWNLPLNLFGDVF